VISAAFKSFATRHHHMNKRAVSEQEFIRRQEKFAETMKMVSSLGRFRALGPEPRSDDVPFEEFLDDLGLPHGNLFHNHETVSDEDLGTVIEEGLEALEKNLGMAMEEGLEALEEITPLTDESIPFSELPTFDVAQGENETDVLEKISDVLEDSSLTDVANETQENSTEEGPKVKDLGSSEIFFDQEVSIENLETKTDIANKTQDNSEEENSMVKVELPSVIKTNQQNESNDVAQDRSDVISERMQEIIVGADEGEGENSEEVPKKTQENSGEESPDVKVEPEVKETDASKGVSETETDVPKKTQEDTGKGSSKDEVDRPPNVASFLTKFMNTFG